MANKYIRHGETYNGDGTSSAAATANGGVGAWNNINVFEGTAPAYGALAAGDVVYIRSKNASGADITRTLTTNTVLGSAAGSITAPVIWVLDHGEMWAGISGTLTYTITSGNYRLDVRAHNVMHTGVVDRIVFAIEQATYYAYLYYLYEGTVLSNVWFRLDAVPLTSSGPAAIRAVGTQNGFTQLINPRISVGAQVYEYLIQANPYSTLYISTPRITLNGGSYTTPLFKTGGGPATIKVYGGSISGDTSGKVLANQANPDGDIQFHGTLIPANISYFATYPTGARGDQRVDGWGVDGGVGSFSARGGGVVDTRQDGYYPTLNGTYPNSSNQGYSWKVTPSNASLANPLDVESSILFTGTAATKTVTVELLVANAFVTAGTDTKGRIWLEVSYVDDTTGLSKSINSAAFGSSTPLDTSTATWSATTYGATLLQKRKIALTTPTTIKKDSVITTVLRWSVKAVSTTDIAFVDPEPYLT